MNGCGTFFDMVKKWTINDYRTQAIKSEVIIDMLISEFIGEMIAAKHDCALGEVKLLAKEFPIDIGSDDLRNAKVDYLVSVKDTLCLVELKTTEDSHSADQKKRMIDVINGNDGAGNMLGFFFDIIRSKRRTPSKMDSKKYFYTLERMKKEFYGTSNQVDDEQFQADMIAKFAHRAPEIIYLELEKPSNDDFLKYGDGKAIEYIVLNEIDSDWGFKALLSAKKAECWGCVKKIIEGISKHL